MNISFKSVLFVLISFALALTSCRKEESEYIETPPEDILEPNSTIANLMLRTATNDGSNDNILDLANCFNIQLPVTVTANSIEITINDTSDYDLVESIFDASNDDSNTIVFSFPITIILTDYTEVIITNTSELYAYTITCNGENMYDDDIECVDFVYPISSSIFNTVNELISTEVFVNDNQLYNFINNISNDEIISINFPISILLADGTQLEINSLNELEINIENSQNDCDEDDDFDYNDDDCNSCTTLDLEEILINCSNWHVDKLERNNIDYDDAYDGYDFNFFSNGTLSVYWDTTTVYGTWSATGANNDIIVIIDIPALPLCNLNWNLHEIENDGNETKIDFRLGDNDRLRYENTCN